jgi:hypothetical protein
MRSLVCSVKNGLASLGVAVAGLLAASLMLTAVAQAADTTTSAPPSAATTATTAAGATTTAGATTATTAPAAGQQSIVPPSADWTPLNPGWRTDQMEIRVMPEYDEKAVLVIVNLTLPANVPLPATIKFPIPAGGQIAGIGEIDPNGNFKYNYQNSRPPITSGFDWDVAAIQVKNYRDIQIEYYYDPGIPQVAGPRSLPLWMEFPVDVGTLVLHVQQPARATGFDVKPALQGTGESDSDHYTYAVGTFANIKAGSQLGQVIDYTNPDNGLSVTTPGSTATNSKISTNTVLLTAILVVVVIIAIVVVWRVFFASRRRRGGGGGAPVAGKNKPAAAAGAKPSAAKPAKPAKPVAPSKPASAVEEPAPPVADEDAATEYCMACGEALSPDSRFCPSCGEARS